MAIPKTAGTNKYLNNGKEKRPETGLLDYRGRQYNPTIGRWMVFDPMGDSYEDYSSYNYMFDNPISWRDPCGRCPTCLQGDAVAVMYAVGATVTNQYGSWTWTRKVWQENATINKPGLVDKWREGNGAQQFAYGLVDSPLFSV